MPPTATPQRNGNGAAPQAAAAAAQLVPFTAAAHERSEPFTVTQTAVPLGAAAVNVGPIDIPASGFLRHVFLEVDLTGGVLGAGVLAADFPFNVFESISIDDVNGAPVAGPLNGYEWLQANIYGGYAYQQDPRKAPWHDATVNAKFMLRIPIEINHYDGLGALQNQNAAQAYKLNLRLNPSTVTFSTPVTTNPSVTVKAMLETWTLPDDRDMANRGQAQYPPAHGTTQYWSKFAPQIVAGFNAIRLPRMGSYIRALVVIARTAAGARADNVFMDPFRLVWDHRDLLNETQRQRIQLAFERLENSTRDTGVFPFTFHHSSQNRAGDGPPNLWLPTVQATRLEFQGSTAAAGTWTVLTNDVAPAEVNPTDRYEFQGSDTGFRPAVGAVRG